MPVVLADIEPDVVVLFDDGDQRHHVGSAWIQAMEPHNGFIMALMPPSPEAQLRWCSFAIPISPELWHKATSGPDGLTGLHRLGGEVAVRLVGLTGSPPPDGTDILVWMYPLVAPVGRYMVHW